MFEYEKTFRYLNKIYNKYKNFAMDGGLWENFNIITTGNGSLDKTLEMWKLLAEVLLQLDDFDTQEQLLIQKIEKLKLRSTESVNKLFKNILTLASNTGFRED